MGWTGYRTNNYKNGKVDVQGEMDKLFNTINSRVLKSAMVGSEYYAAVEETTVKDGVENRIVFAAIFQTSTRRADGCNIFYKDMDETVVNGYYKCPVGILKLLTPTDNANAKAWREGCLKWREEQKAKKSDPDSLKNLPEGSQIRFTINFSTTSGLKPGDEVTLSKVAKRQWNCNVGGYAPTGKFYWTDGYYRWREKHIPADYTVVGRGQEAA